MEPTALQTTWFVLITFLFIGYFVLEGFDFGVGMNSLALGRGDAERRGEIIETVGPIWDGNQVWVIVGGASIFAAFPEWYASLFSGFYLALLLLLHLAWRPWPRSSLCIPVPPDRGVAPRDRCARATG